MLTPRGSDAWPPGVPQRRQIRGQADCLDSPHVGTGGEADVLGVRPRVGRNEARLPTGGEGDGLALGAQALGGVVVALIGEGGGSEKRLVKGRRLPLGGGGEQGEIEPDPHDARSAS